jgi:hypothetical protein
MSHLLTERQAMRWVQKYISAFGGDPTKVTMYACLSPYRNLANILTSAGVKVLVHGLLGYIWSPMGEIQRDFSALHSWKVARQSRSVISLMDKATMTSL